MREHEFYEKDFYKKLQHVFVNVGLLSIAIPISITFSLSLAVIEFTLSAYLWHEFTLNQ